MPTIPKPPPILCTTHCGTPVHLHQDRTHAVESRAKVNLLGLFFTQNLRFATFRFPFCCRYIRRQNTNCRHASVARLMSRS